MSGLRGGFVGSGWISKVFCENSKKKFRGEIGLGDLRWISEVIELL